MTSVRGIVILAIISIVAVTAWLWWSGKNPFVSPAGVSRETQEALEATKDYSDEQQKAFQSAVEDELEAMEDQLESMRAKTNAASGEARDELEEVLEDLEEKKRAAGKKLAQLKSANEQAWATVMSSMTAAMEDMQASYRRAVNKAPAKEASK